MFMKKIIKIIPWVLLVITIFLLITQNSTSKSQTDYLYSSSLLNSPKITCTFDQTSRIEYMNSKRTYEIPPKETNPLIFTFSDLDNSNLATLNFIDATQSISTVSIVKVFENKEKYIFLEGSGENYFTVHTIYKTEGIATYVKNVNIFGNIATTTAMGYCNSTF